VLNLLGGLLGGGKGGALATISKVVDELHTSEEEKLDKKILMQRLQQKLAEKQLDVNAKEASCWLATSYRMGWSLCFNVRIHFISMYRMV
jgi:hypothetical protein